MDEGSDTEEGSDNRSSTARAPPTRTDGEVLLRRRREAKEGNA